MISSRRSRSVRHRAKCGPQSSARTGTEAPKPAIRTRFGPSPVCNHWRGRSHARSGLGRTHQQSFLLSFNLSRVWSLQLRTWASSHKSNRSWTRQLREQRCPFARVGQAEFQVPWHDRQTCMFTATWPQDCRTSACKQRFCCRCAESGKLLCVHSTVASHPCQAIFKLVRSARNSRRPTSRITVNLGCCTLCFQCLLP